MNLTPLKAIRKKCLDCCCDSANEVKLCPATDCPLYIYRLGKNPHRTGLGNKQAFAQSPDTTSDSNANRLSVGNYTPDGARAEITHPSRKEKPFSPSTDQSVDEKSQEE